MDKHLYLVAIDGSEWSERAAQRAVALAKSNGSRVKLLCVLDWSRMQPIVAEGFVTPSVNTRDEEAYVTKNIFAPLQEKYADSGVKIDYEMMWGEPVEVLRDQVKAQHANMLFVGRRGRSRITDLLLGSVANKLAHCIGIPIVLVP
ncbi:universal stress protein [Thalassomonas actiniarum]|uniref:Universal stress protein n=1 Tax=Thalassomonas actiniarum TaxID=485447 RepID=A0AAF0C5Y0_9GAMM|nr:universal stress protein [Thalassomonas actiniarum]WDE01439.1 universal stress protein [Thalassomonas actiniarum]